METKKYDLEERTFVFAKNLLLFLQTFPKDFLNFPLVQQLIRSATSIGANYMESVQACSKKDFQNKIRISQKEANETRYWLRLLVELSPQHKEKIQKFEQEAFELTLIFAKISKSCVVQNN